MKYKVNFEAYGTTRTEEIDGKDILIDWIDLDSSYSDRIRNTVKGKNRLFIINEFGVLCAVFAGSENDALDLAADKGKLKGLSVNVDEYNEDDESIMYLGNESLPFDATYYWLGEMKGKQDDTLIAALIHANEEGESNLDFELPEYVVFVDSNDSKIIAKAKMFEEMLTNREMALSFSYLLSSPVDKSLFSIMPNDGFISLDDGWRFYLSEERVIVEKKN